MSTVTNLAIGPVKFITTDADGPTSLAAIQTNGSLHNLSLEDLGDLSEFIATDWLNIAGEEYGAGFNDHVDSVTLYSGEHVIHKSSISDTEFNMHMDLIQHMHKIDNTVERDCE